MTEQKTNDSEFQTYLEGKSSLSRLYHQTESTGPGKHIDDAIMKAATEESKKHIAGTFTHGYRWYIPITLAASLLIAIMIVRVALFNNVPEPDTVAETDKAPDGQHLGASKASPEIMLRKINQLMMDGKQEQAQQEYELFIELFPQHEIDLQRYPGIKNLKDK